MQFHTSTCPKFTPSEEINYCKKFTEIFRQHTSVIEREIACLIYQTEHCFCSPQEGDTYVGRFTETFVCFSPQPDCGGLGYAFHQERIDDLLHNTSLSNREREVLQELSTFWNTENTTYKIQVNYPEDIRRWLCYEDYHHDRAVAHPLYRLSGSQMDYKKLLCYGIDGLHKLIEQASLQNKDSMNFYNGLHSVLHIFTNLCRQLLHNIEVQLTDSPHTTIWNNKLQVIKSSLEHIQSEPPRNFYDAIQLTLLWWFFSGSLNLERMDTYLAEYYVQDVKNGILTEEEALDMLSEMWKMLSVRKRPYDTRIVIGGKGRDNVTDSDAFCLLAIEATRRLHSTTPQLALRIYRGMSDTVYQRALDAIGEGCTFPMLYNDDVNIPAIQNAFQLDEKTATGYCPYGCGEYVMAHQSLATPSGIINLAKALEITLNHGRDLETDATLGIDTGGIEEFETFEQLYKAYQMQVEHFVRLLAVQEELEYRYAGEHAAFLVLSLLYDDCIEKGTPILTGGAKYLGGTLESYGNVNAADSLTAIKTMVYEKQEISREDLLDSLKQNFSNSPQLRLKLRSCPKYGNDLDIADCMLQQVHDHICNTTRDSVHLTSLHHYLTVIINNDANTVLGHLTAASADGRLSGMPLANANNPQGGMDSSGLTAMLNSLVKPDCKLHAGSVQNLKLSKDLFTSDMLPKTKALLKTYFELGGTQLMITVVSRHEMEDAMIHPEAHQNLIVRVGGFSAHFVDLLPDVQKELIARTLFA